MQQPYTRREAMERSKMLCLFSLGNVPARLMKLEHGIWIWAQPEFRRGAGLSIPRHAVGDSIAWLPQALSELFVQRSSV